jgi:16S rRNA (guanine527-N7)-methyltransferase
MALTLATTFRCQYQTRILACRSSPASSPASTSSTSQLQQFVNCVLNEPSNLTSAKTETAARAELVSDSLALLSSLLPQSSASGASQAPSLSRVVDIGSGAGAPGIPLAISLPLTEFTLVEPRKKRADFISRVASEHLRLPNVTVLRSRAEDLARDEILRERFDAAVAKAVAPLPALAELCLPFVAVGGRLVASKGSRASEEVIDATNAIESLGGSSESVEEHKYKESCSRSRSIVVVHKARESPSRFPRKTGTCQKRPIR